MHKNWTDVKCTVLCFFVVASAFGADPNSYTQQHQRDTLTITLADRIAELQQQANNGRHEARKEEMRLQFASDNFSLPENGLFRYRAIFTKPGEKSTVIDKTIDFT